MDNIKLIIAKNISELRKKMGITQFELAEKLNYSDKAVSKWERGESVPDITVLKAIADLFGVTVDYLITEEHESYVQKLRNISRRKKYNHGFITGMGIVAVWLVATLAFVLIHTIFGNIGYHWLSFAYAVPASFIVWLVFNSIWFNSRMNFVIVSLMMWSMLACLCLSLMTFGLRMWMILVPGIPGQVIIILWSMIKTKAREMEEKKK